MRCAAITNSLPNSPEPNNIIFFSCVVNLSQSSLFKIEYSTFLKLEMLFNECRILNKYA